MGEAKTKSSDPSTFSDPAFLSRLRAKDPLALEGVVHAYLPQILRAARGAGLDPHRAEDVTQSVFLTFVETIERFEGRSHVRTWLFGILYRKLSETWRKVAKDRALDDIDGVVEARFAADGTWFTPPRETDRETLDGEIRAHLSACLDTVPERQRMAFLLREVQGLTTSEICKVLGVTDTNLGVLLFRARNRLRECLEERSLKE